MLENLEFDMTALLGRLFVQVLHLGLQGLPYFGLTCKSLAGGVLPPLIKWPAHGVNILQVHTASNHTKICPPLKTLCSWGGHKTPTNVEMARQHVNSSCGVYYHKLRKCRSLIRRQRDASIVKNQEWLQLKLEWAELQESTSDVPRWVVVTVGLQVNCWLGKNSFRWNNTTVLLSRHLVVTVYSGHWHKANLGKESLKMYKIFQTHKKRQKKKQLA